MNKKKNEKFLKFKHLFESYLNYNNSELLDDKLIIIKDEKLINTSIALFIKIINSIEFKNINGKWSLVF